MCILLMQQYDGEGEVMEKKACVLNRIIKRWLSKKGTT